jgi:hypothetical protein
MNLFHVSTLILQSGESPFLAGTKSISPVEAIVDSLRPANRPSRLRAWFACESTADCAAYFEAQQSSGWNRDSFDGKTPHYYSVRMPAPTKLPMALIGRAERELNAGGGLIEAIVHAYWNPDNEWNFWEYLDERIEVLAEVDGPDVLAVSASRWHYMSDYTRSRQLWPTS